MREIVVDPVTVLIIATTVLWIGERLTKKISFLASYNIPASVTGGLLCSGLVACAYYVMDVEIRFDLELRDTLLLAFFSTIGLSARLRPTASSGG